MKHVCDMDVSELNALVTPRVTLYLACGCVYL